MSRIVVVGTAGHVDHGKSTLVRALTGTDPDRLAEEKRRGMTIDLGFAWARLPGGAVLSLVDVPGHEDFIRNMLAGAGGVDAAILVVAADEGPMPQTREHLDILDLLGVHAGIVALTKADLVEPDWLRLIEEETRLLLAPTGLRDAPIVPLSAETGEGLPGFVARLEGILADLPPPRDLGRPRLSVDRAFTLAGFGTVVTGTLRDGRLKVGETVALQPQDLRSRLRGLHAHGQAVDVAAPGTRTALNLVGLEPADAPRGTLISLPDAYRATQLVDLRVRALPQIEQALVHDLRVHVYHGAAEIPGFLRVLGGQTIEPGEEGYAQIRLDRPLVAAAGDRLVLRLPSPERTIGGARILDLHPVGRRRRFSPAVMSRMATMAEGPPAERLWQLIAEREPCKAARLRAVETGMETPERDAALRALAASGRVLSLAGHWLTDQGWARLRRMTELILRRYHRRYPLRPGLPLEELRGQLRLPPDLAPPAFERAAAEGWLARDGDTARDPGHTIQFSSSQDEAVVALLARFRAQAFVPPSLKEAEAAVGTALLDALVKQGELIRVSPEVLFDKAAYEAIRQGVVDLIHDRGQMTLADLRDHVGTSRKYAQAILEHFDRVRLTRRVGDARVLVSDPGAPGAPPDPA